MVGHHPTERSLPKDAEADKQSLMYHYHQLDSHLAEKQEGWGDIPILVPIDCEIDAQSQDEEDREPEANVENVQFAFDLLFGVAIGIFGVTNSQADPAALHGTIAFFTVVWLTWLHSTLLSPQLAIQPLLHDIYRVFAFGVMVAFGICASRYNAPGVEHLYWMRAVTFLLVVSRFMLAIMHGLRSEEATDTESNTIWAVGCNITAGLALLGTISSMKSTNDAYLGWGVAAVVDIISVISTMSQCDSSALNASLRDRLETLTLLVILQALFGSLTSTYHLFMYQVTLTPQDIGHIMCAAIQMFLTYVLYFSRRDNPRRSNRLAQILLHLPLQLGIICLGKSSTQAVAATALDHVVDVWKQLYPLVSCSEWSSYFSQYLSPGDIASALARDIEHFLRNDVQKQAAESVLRLYSYPAEISKLRAISAPFNSTPWQEQATDVITSLWEGVGGALQAALQSRIYPRASLYAAGGCLLLVLAVMELASGRRHSKELLMSVATRVVVGSGILFVALTSWLGDAKFAVDMDQWTVALVMTGFFAVALFDHVAGWISGREENVGDFDWDDHTVVGDNDNVLRDDLGTRDSISTAEFLISHA